MTTIEFFKNIAAKIKKYKILILIPAIICAIIFYLPELNKKTIYTAKATLFPLNSDNENSSSLSGLLGLSGDASRSFGSNNAVNILELTVSRTLMQTVASKRTGLNNKTISELLVDERNNNTSFFSNKIKFPSDSLSQVLLGASLLSENFTAKINKNNVLELYYSNTNTALLEPITDTIISEITKFYTNLKIEKALADYNFTIAQLDSVQKNLDKLDSKAIGMQSTTMFTSEKLLTYQIPKNYVADAKDMASRQKDILINNKEEAMWRLQKITPIVEVLDKPEAPFDSKRSTPLLMGFIGFLLGGFLAMIVAISGVLYTYVRSEILKAISE